MMSGSILRQFVLLIGLFALSLSALGQKSMLMGSFIGVQSAQAAVGFGPEIITAAVGSSSKTTGGGVLCMSVSCLMCQSDRSMFSIDVPGTVVAMQFDRVPDMAPNEPLPQGLFHPPRA